jgi:predicted O-methyltransferase YrrM
LARSFRRLAQLAFSNLKFFTLQPHMIPIVLGHSTCTPEEAVRTLLRDVPAADIRRYIDQLRENSGFFAAFQARMRERRGREADFKEWYYALYAIMRLTKPRLVMETGVFDGQSSGIILQAMADNDAGQLISIDLPATDMIQGSTHLMPETSLPPGCQPGWAVPDHLRERYQLVLGDSKTLLPALLKENEPLDIFLHDSLHTYAHQYFEYSTAWDHIRAGGFLMSDDIYWSAAFDRFCREQGRSYVRVGGYGATRK